MFVYWLQNNASASLFIFYCLIGFYIIQHIGYIAIIVNLILACWKFLHAQKGILTGVYEQQTYDGVSQSCMQIVSICKQQSTDHQLIPTLQTISLQWHNMSITPFEIIISATVSFNSLFSLSAEGTSKLGFTSYARELIVRVNSHHKGPVMHLLSFLGLNVLPISHGFCSWGNKT